MTNSINVKVETTVTFKAKEVHKLIIETTDTEVFNVFGRDDDGADLIFKKEFGVDAMRAFILHLNEYSEYLRNYFLDITNTIEEKLKEYDEIQVVLAD